MDILLGVLISLAIIAATSVVTVVLTVRVLFRRIRRSHVVNAAVLESRAHLSPGPRRKVFALELRLARALDSGRAAIDLAVRSNGRRGELPRLFRRIEAEGLTLQTQLRLMESETDAGTLTEQLSVAGRQVDQVADMIRRMRASVAAGFGDPTGAALATLSADVDLEVASLHAGLVELANLNAGDQRYNPTDARQSSADHLQARGVQS
ncbi:MULTISPECIES: hypothetical protein [unclassified Diaminobutyricimonas]|uniref:hypothetical protein n=1 Tax=unclassified Diaminobutyricimonas TaxID=2643261 RepID=UPI0012F500B0|nr:MULTISPECIES: hypothetical protein [unclassified Diaminobutyricimonas]